MRTFKSGENVLYTEGNRLVDAKIIRHDPLANSYLVRLMYKNGTIRERETVSNRLKKKQPGRSSVETLIARTEALNRRMNEMRSELAYISGVLRVKRQNVPLRQHSQRKKRRTTSGTPRNKTPNWHKFPLLFKNIDNNVH